MLKDIYVIGDIHGCFEQLENVLQQIQHDHLKNKTSDKPRLVLLGDYIDRGKDSRLVVELLSSKEFAELFDFVPLRGNHEQEVLLLMDEMKIFPEQIASFEGCKSFLDNGGDVTLHNYGYNANVTGVIEFVKSMPIAHKNFLKNTHWHFEYGDYFFVHAGIDPDRDIADQDLETLISIRGKFLKSNKNHGKIIVHGHTPIKDRKVYIGPNRICLDTGAGYEGGVLSAICIRSNKSIDIFQA